MGGSYWQRVLGGGILFVDFGPDQVYTFFLNVLTVEIMLPSDEIIIDNHALPQFQDGSYRKCNPTWIIPQYSCPLGSKGLICLIATRQKRPFKHKWVFVLESAPIQAFCTIQ